MNKTLRHSGERGRIKHAIVVPHADWVKRRALRLPLSEVSAIKLPCAAAIVNEDETRLIATLVIHSTEGVGRVRGHDWVVLDQRHYAVLSNRARRWHFDEPARPPPPPAVLIAPTTEAGALHFTRHLFHVMRESVAPGSRVRIEELVEEVREYGIMLADAAVVDDLGPTNVCLVAAALRRWKAFSIVRSPERRMRALLVYVRYAVATMSRVNREAWYTLERAIVRIQANAMTASDAAGTVAVPLIDWLGCGGASDGDVDHGAVPRAVFHEVVEPYVHARELALWTEARITARNLAPPSLSAQMEAFGVVALCVPVDAAATTDAKITHSTQLTTYNAEANADWIGAVTRTAAVHRWRRGVRTPSLATQTIGDIEDLDRHAPPCMRAVIKQARQTHHLKDYDRFTMVPWLFHLGVTDGDLIMTYLTDTRPALQKKIAAERGRWDRAVAQRPPCVGCAKLRHETIAGTINPGNAVHCPYMTASECLRDASLPETTPLVTPVDFVRARMATVAAITPQ